MNQFDDPVSRADEVTIERWEYDNPSWIVIAHHPVITTSPDGKVLEEIEVQVQHQATGGMLRGVGTDLVMALALITHRLSEQC